MKTLLHAFCSDRAGSIGFIAALASPVMVCAAVLGTEAGSWAYKHQTMQGVTDAAAISGVVSGLSGTALTIQAQAITAASGFVAGIGGVNIQVNSPPAAGAYTGISGAVEVILQQAQRPMLASALSSNFVSIRSRSVAIRKPGGACLLALNATASGAITLQGTSQVVLSGCDGFSNSASSSSMVAGGSANLTLGSASAVGGIGNTSNITAANGIYTGAASLPDPYAAEAYPTPGACSQSYSGGSITLYPGVYCGGIALSGGANVTLNPGIYFMEGGDLKVAGNSTLTGDGVTIVFTSSNGSSYAGAAISSNAVINLTAPQTAPTAGIVLFGDRAMTPGTAFKLTGGGTQNWGGALYLPKAALTYAGGATGGTGCTQIVADTVTFTGNSNMSLNCDGYGVTPIGNQIAALVE
jgi:hypothetical protein